jgi:hypothetical protein
MIIRLLFRSFLTILLLAVGVLLTPPATATEPLNLADYWQQVRDTRATVADLTTAPPGVAQPQLQALAAAWEARTAVVLPDGATVPLDHSFLVAQLRAEPPDLARLEALLSTLLTVQQEISTSPHTAADVAPLTEILARSEFNWQPQQPSPLALLWRHIIGYLLKFMSWFIPEESILVGPWFSYLLTGVGVLTVFLVLLYLSRGLLADFAAQTEVEIPFEAGDEHLTADSAFKRAQTLSGEGDYRTAVRYLYLSSLLLLDERGLLRYDRARTNREYLRSVAHTPTLAARLREVIDIFDRVWYGYQPLDEATYHRYAEQVAELRRQR